ncbi:MAG: hypothetical protein EDQ89_12290 [Acidobacteria bacterium]|nr:MAG: hypothetical protein EDQ89_12290 [Acidobacteriota bacterium]MCL4288617.1 hypothetical protein [Thermoleophilia bacterium]GIK77908.1 MAG: hypothetical protein BroJett022_15980 [Actinomycetes bacterium]
MIVEGRVQIPFRYAAGAAASRFGAALRDERRILGARCTGCDRVLCPPGPFCGSCGGAAGAAVEVGPGATLLAWTELPDRGAFALVRLDGADGALAHRLVDVPEPRVGMRLRARFAPERGGDIRDIEGFGAEGIER